MTNVQTASIFMRWKAQPFLSWLNRNRCLTLINLGAFREVNPPDEQPSQQSQETKDEKKRPNVSTSHISRTGRCLVGFKHRRRRVELRIWWWKFHAHFESPLHLGSPRQRRLLIDRGLRSTAPVALLYPTSGYSSSFWICPSKSKPESAAENT